MKKRDVKVIRKNAGAMPACYYLATMRFPNTIDVPISGREGTIQQKVIDSKPIAVRVNHARRLRHAYQRGGQAGMQAYLAKVSKAVHDGGHIMERHCVSYRGLTLSKVSAATA